MMSSLLTACFCITPAADPERGGCDFARFFRTTPADLIEDGLYKMLAVTCHPGRYRTVSMALLTKALGAERQGGSIRHLSTTITEALQHGTQSVVEHSAHAIQHSAQILQSTTHTSVERSTRSIQKSSSKANTNLAATRFPKPKLRIAFRKKVIRNLGLGALMAASEPTTVVACAIKPRDHQHAPASNV
mgnify:CR=1 FL=1